MPGSRIYYGWWVLLGIFTSYAALVGVQVYTLPIIYPEMRLEYGWNAEEVSRANSIFFYTGAFITPFISSLYDRYSVRKFMLAGVAITVIGLGALSGVTTVNMMIVIFIGLALSQVCSGQVPTMVLVTRWFRRYRGIAVGIALMSTSVGAAIFPKVVAYVMVDGDWHDAIRVLMIISGVMMALPVIFLIRNRPGDMGLYPDGDPAPAPAVQDDLPASPPPEGTTLREALAMPAFWLLVITTGSLWFIINGIVVHGPSYLGLELHMDIQGRANVASLTFLAAIAGKLLFGWLSDRFSKTLIMLAGVINLGLGLVILRLTTTGDPVTLYGYAVVFGVGFAGTFTMIQLVIAEFFAGGSYGRILGLLTMVDVSSAGLGISIIAMLQGRFGSYLPVFEILIGQCGVVAVLVYVLHHIRLNMHRRARAAVAVSAGAAP